METQIGSSIRNFIGALSAVAIVGFSVLVLDQGHIAAAPRGVVEIGELIPAEATMVTSAVLLPEIIVVGRAEQAPVLMAASLPEVIVKAERVVAQVASLGGAGDGLGIRSSTPAAGALLQ
ncbi:MAG: hypothetical protein FJ191_02495 [Gammaproteobacteria bacterium]|nr:hypothetical protein [Gammaproteobacteria bacterium]